MTSSLNWEPIPTTTSILLRCIIYVITNSAQPLLVDLMKHQGAASASTFLFVAPTYLAMVLLGLGPREKSIWEERKRYLFIIYLALGDIVHQLMEKVGLIFAGSAVYMMASSSVSIWTAIISRYVLKKRVSFTQWTGIFLICTGLSLKGFQASQSGGKNEIIGGLLTIFAAMLHALVSVLNEKFLNDKEPIEGLNFVFLTGLFSSSLLGIWTVFWTIPRWDELIVNSIHKKNGSPQIAILCFLLLLLCGILRSSTLWYLLKHLGAVTSGVLKGVRTPTVFFLSHVLYCHLEPSQCLSPLKTCAAILCASGVMVYSIKFNKENVDCEDKKIASTEAIESTPLKSTQSS